MKLKDLQTYVGSLATGGGIIPQITPAEKKEEIYEWEIMKTSPIPPSRSGIREQITSVERSVKQQDSANKRWVDYADWSTERRHVFHTGELGREQMESAMLEYVAEQRRLLIETYSRMERNMLYGTYRKRNVNSNTKTL